jgi:hypothetical protein
VKTYFVKPHDGLSRMVTLSPKIDPIKDEAVGNRRIAETSFRLIQASLLAAVSTDSLLEARASHLNFTCLTRLIECFCVLSKWRSSMVTSGQVKNGVIVLNKGAQLPEGQ